jgi:hypothetical protein
VLVVGGDEHDLRPDGEPGQHPREIQAVQAGHPDVTEDHVELLGLQRAQRFGSAARRAHPAHPRIRFE